MSEASPPVGRANPPADATPPTGRVLMHRPPMRAVPMVRSEGFPLDHPYVRRWWTCALGPTAIADLLRLGRAATRGASLPLPLGLPRLLAVGLVHHTGRTVVVPTRVPPVPERLLARMPVHLREQHRLEVAGTRLAG
jgi:hypothetical protein